MPHDIQSVVKQLLFFKGHRRTNEKLDGHGGYEGGTFTFSSEAKPVFAPTDWRSALFLSVANDHPFFQQNDKTPRPGSFDSKLGTVTYISRSVREGTWTGHRGCVFVMDPK